ncbi:MAG: hypothetical protein SF051_02940 [Elusimicrobiota bacterium]|nr:hypothetical protein [Elusimicrobiota bacterium]
MSRLAALLGVAALFFVSVDLRLRRATQTPRWDPADGTGYYRAESAFQYRLARLAAGEGIPAVDKAAQWPEGVDTRRETTTVMERATGLAWRLLPAPRPDLRWFVVCWVAFVSSLSLLAFYAAAWRLTRDPPLALAATAAYGLSWVAQANVAGTYGFEGFALPVMHLGLAAALAALDRETRDPVPWAFASGAALGLAMGSWHFARLYLLSFLAALAWVVLRAGRDADAVKRARLVAISGVGGALAAMLAAPAARPGGGSSLAHAWAMLGEKVLHLLRKPADPASLSVDARLLWTGPFDSPEAAFLVFCLAPFGLMFLPRLLSRGAPKPPPARAAAWELAAALAALYAAGALMVSRLLPMAAFFAGLWALRVADKRRVLALRLFWAVAALEAFKLLAPASPLNPAMWLSAPLARLEYGVPAAFRHERALLSWLRRHAAPDKPVLAGIGVSGSILAYADAPTVIHPKFEAAPIRRKVADYLAALTADEAALAAFCARHGAAFVVHATADLLDETDDGTRYLAGRRGLDATMPLYRFHFDPGSLASFTLVYENPDYRVFAVGASTRPWRSPPLAVYDARMFEPEYGPGSAVRLKTERALARMHRARRQLVLAAMLARAGRFEEAVLRYDESASQWPPDPEYRGDFEKLKEILRRRSPAP